MKRLFTSITFFTLFSLNCYSQKSTTEFTNTQRAALQNFISSYSQYQFIPETWFDKGTLKAIRNEWGFGKNYKPYFQNNDFNKDGIKDFAVILLNSNDKTNAAVVVFNGLKNGNFKFVHIEKEPFESELGLSFQDKKLNVLVFETGNMGCFISSGKGYIVEPCGGGDEN
jgi:hypothetical protein